MEEKNEDEILLYCTTFNNLFW